MALVLLIVKASLVLLSALGASALLGRSAAATRHRLWSVAFALVLAVPALALVMPALNVPMPEKHQATVTSPGMKGSERPPRGPSLSSDLLAVAPAASSQVEEFPPITHALSDLPFPFIVGMIWAVGCIAALLLLWLSLIRVRRLSKDSDELIDAAWQTAAADISMRLGMSVAPRLVVTGQAASPMAGGVSQPTVFLPLNARSWDAERRDVVLTHEIAHLASRDPLRHLIARVAVACYWFHPLAWLAAHRATVSREEAADEAVLAAGTRPSSYARVLLELAESAGTDSALITALPMAQRSNLEKRLMTILRSDARSSSTRGSIAVAVCLGVVTLAVAAARPYAAVVEVIKSGPPSGAIGAAESARLEQGARPERTFQGTTDACRWNNDESFSGRIDNNRSGVTMRIGRTDSQAVMQRSFEGLRVCMVADGIADRVDRPQQMIDRATRVSLSSERDGQTQQMDIVRTGGSARTTWLVNGKDRQVAASAEEWRRSMLALLDNVWEASQIRGQVSSLRGEISSIYGEESSLRGEISSISGEVSSLQGEISGILGHESSLRGEISSIQGRLSSLRGEISSEQGAISSLNARRYEANSSEERRIQASIDEHRKQMAAIEREISAFNADGKVREVQKAIDSYNADAQVRNLQRKIESFGAQQRVGGVERQIEALKVSEKVRDLEKQIESLHADGRVEVLETQQVDLLKRLRAAISAIR
jgi:beta-lactamase regulating signal transducer with metallopeptidase domain/predicted  nucleic acid-binding Zn-ribbon protein